MARDGRERSFIYYSRVLGARQQAQHRASSTPCLSGHHFPCQNVAWDEPAGCLRAARSTGCPASQPHIPASQRGFSLCSCLVCLHRAASTLPRQDRRVSMGAGAPCPVPPLLQNPLPTSLVAAEMLTGAILLLGHLPTAPLSTTQPAPATDVCLQAVFQGGMNYTQGASFQCFPLPVAYGG